MKKRTIELYGRLKDAGFGAKVALELPANATARVALNLLHAKVGKAMKGAALATSDAVLAPTDRLPKSGRLAALPPVCGG